MKFIVNNTPSTRPEFLFYNTQNLHQARQKELDFKRLSGAYFADIENKYIS